MFRGSRFLVLLYFKSKFFWEQENFGGPCPRMPSRGYGPAS